MTAEKTGALQRGRPFEPGTSGNPNGRPRGSRNKTTMAVQALFDGEAEALSRKVIELAKGGDMIALRLCLDRILPPRKDRHLSFDFPAITSPQEAAGTIAAVLIAVANGELTPAEATEVGKLVDVYVRALEATELSERDYCMRTLERLVANGGPAGSKAGSLGGRSLASLTDNDLLHMALGVKT